MKKTLSLLLAICTCLMLGAIFTSCDKEEPHTHEFATEWSKDETHHWLACTGTDCTEISDKAEHTWDEGEITTAPTTDADGEKTFTCTVCQAKKSKTLKLLDAESWAKMLAWLEYENYTLEITQAMKLTPQDAAASRQVVKMKFTADKVAYEQTVYLGDEKGELGADVYTGEDAESVKHENTFMIAEFLKDFSKYTYDATKQAYVLAEPTTISFEDLYEFSQDFVLSEATVLVDDDGRITDFSCKYSQTVHYTEEISDTFYAEMTFRFYDYGTTVI